MSLLCTTLQHQAQFRLNPALRATLFLFNYVKLRRSPWLYHCKWPP